MALAAGAGHGGRGEGHGAQLGWGTGAWAPPRAGERAPGPQESRWRAGGEAGRPTPRDRRGLSPTPDAIRDHSPPVPASLQGAQQLGVSGPQSCRRTGRDRLPRSPCLAPALKHHHFMGPASSDVLLFLMQGNTWSLSPHVGPQGSSGAAVTTAPCEDLLSALLTSFLCTNLVRS